VGKACSNRALVGVKAEIVPCTEVDPPVGNRLSGLGLRWRGWVEAVDAESWN
jgi:hypothetical protein